MYWKHEVSMMGRLELLFFSGSQTTYTEVEHEDQVTAWHSTNLCGLLDCHNMSHLIMRSYSSSRMSSCFFSNGIDLSTAQQQYQLKHDTNIKYSCIVDSSSSHWRPFNVMTSTLYSSTIWTAADPQVDVTKVHNASNNNSEWDQFLNNTLAHKRLFSAVKVRWG